MIRDYILFPLYGGAMMLAGVKIAAAAAHDEKINSKKYFAMGTVIMLSQKILSDLGSLPYWLGGLGGMTGCLLLPELYFEISNPDGNRIVRYLSNKGFEKNSIEAIMSVASYILCVFPGVVVGIAVNLAYKKITANGQAI